MLNHLVIHQRIGAVERELLLAEAARERLARAARNAAGAEPYGLKERLGRALVRAGQALQERPAPTAA